MGLFTQLEKFDQKLTRGYARWGRWVWRTLIVVPVLVVLWNIGQAVWGGPRGGVILEIHSEIDRPILGFSVNGVAGANAFANGGGSITCCGDVSGDTAEVIMKPWLHIWKAGSVWRDIHNFVALMCRKL